MERRAGQARLRMYISFVISLVRLHIFFWGREWRLSFVFSFVFLTGGWGPDYDRLGRYWCQGKGHMVADT